MPKFEISGKGKDTNRQRRRIYTATTESEAKQQAEIEGILIEGIRQLPPDPPTDRQISYARDLGIFIPANITKDDLSDLISIIVDRDKPASEIHKNYGRMFGVE